MKQYEDWVKSSVKFKMGGWSFICTCSSCNLVEIWEIAVALQREYRWGFWMQQWRLGTWGRFIIICIWLSGLVCLVVCLSVFLASERGKGVVRLKSINIKCQLAAWPLTTNAEQWGNSLKWNCFLLQFFQWNRSLNLQIYPVKIRKAKTIFRESVLEPF